MQNLNDIRKKLAQKSQKTVTASLYKFIPTAKGVYGVKFSILDQMAKNFRDADINLIKALWRSGRFEEQILAAKILSFFAPKYPDQAWRFIVESPARLYDWAVCDTLATYGVRPLISSKQRPIFLLSKRLLKSKNIWQRRFGLVLLVNFTKDKKLKNDILGIISELEADSEPYIKKAISWVRRNLQK